MTKWKKVYKNKKWNLKRERKRFPVAFISGFFLTFLFRRSKLERLLNGVWSSGRSGRTSDAADETRFVAGDALESRKLGGEVVAVDGFLGAGTDGTRQVAVAAARIADGFRSNALFKWKNIRFWKNIVRK
jgi:hypothetical protein